MHTSVRPYAHVMCEPLKCEEPLVQPVYYVMQFNIRQVDNDTSYNRSAPIQLYCHAHAECTIEYGAKIQPNLPSNAIATGFRPPGKIFVLKILFSPRMFRINFTHFRNTHARASVSVSSVYVCSWPYTGASRARSKYIHQYDEWMIVCVWALSLPLYNSA